MIFVTGASGMLGSEICRLLKEREIPFAAAGHEVDVTNFASIKNFLSGCKKNDVVINCAAYTKVDLAEIESEKAFAVNAKGPENLAEIAAEKQAVLIHFSTDYVFGGQFSHTSGQKLKPFSETDSTFPQSIYGKSKLEGEKAVKKICTSHYIFRTGWLYGKSGTNFVFTILSLLKTKSEIKVVYDQKGTPTNCKTVAGAVLKILESQKSGTPEKLPSFGTYNLTDKGDGTWFDFACEIQKLAALKNPGILKCRILPCSTEDFSKNKKPFASRPLYSVLDKSKFEKGFGIKLLDWKESLKEFFDSAELN